MIDRQYLLTKFRYHPPIDHEQAVRYEEIRERGLYFAEFLNENVPDCHEKSVMVDKLREVVMWANAAIACNERPDPAALTPAGLLAPSRHRAAPTAPDTGPEHPSFPEPFRGGGKT